MVRAFAIMLLLLAALGAATREAMAHVGRASELMRDEQYAQAAAELETALKQDPALSEARLNLAICRFQLRDYGTARALLAGAKSRLATYYLARIDLIEGHTERAMARFRSLAAGGEVRDEKYYLAVADIDEERYAEAATLLREWIAENLRDFRAHQRLARTLLKLGQPQEAAREFENTRELHAWYTGGSVALRACSEVLRSGKNDEAWTQCAPLADTDDVDKLVALGMMFGQAGDAGHARAIWDKAVALDPDSPEINYNLALACYQMHKMACGRTYASNALRLWPDFPEANVLYGTILYQLRDDTQARRVLEHARQLRPDDAMVGRLLIELGAQK